MGIGNSVAELLVQRRAARIPTGLRWIEPLHQSPLAYLLILRFFFGAYFLVSAISKLRERWLGAPIDVAQPTARPVLATILDQFAHSNPYPPYKRFLLHVVLPRATIFRWIVVVGEMLVGLSLFTGTLTRVGALFGIFANLNYLLMKGVHAPEGGIDQAFIAGLLVTLLGNPGRILGGDRLIHRRWPRYPLW